jgi:membrane protein
MSSVVKESVTKWMDVNAPRLSAALAYYTVFSLAPLLVVVVAIAGLAFGRQAAEGQIAAQMRGLIGGQGAEAIQTMLSNAHQSGGGPLALGLGLLVLLFGASGVFVELRSSLNTIWGVEAAEPSGLGGWVRKRFSAFGLVLAIGFLMLVSLLINAALAVVIRYFNQVLPLPGPVMYILGIAFSFAVSVAVFALLY